jgi:hypothetical protein
MNKTWFLIAPATPWSKSMATVALPKPSGTVAAPFGIPVITVICMSEGNRLMEI